MPQPLPPALLTAIRQTLRPCANLTLKRERKPSLTPATIAATRFGHLPYAEAADTWPICGGCNKPLTFVAQFNVTDANVNNSLSGLYVFHYCHECGSWGDIPADLKDAWRVKHYANASAVRAAEIAVPKTYTPATACSTSSSLQLDAPDWEDASEEISKLCTAANPQSAWDAYEAAVSELLSSANTDDDDSDDEDLDDEDDDADTAGTKIGGHPHWIQGSDIPDCPHCKEPMTLIAQIGSEDEADIMRGDAGSVYLFACPKHPTETRMTLQCF